MNIVSAACNVLQPAPIATSLISIAKHVQQRLNIVATLIQTSSFIHTHHKKSLRQSWSIMSSVRVTSMITKAYPIQSRERIVNSRFTLASLSARLQQTVTSVSM